MKKTLLCMGMAILLGVTGCTKAETQEPEQTEQPQKTAEQIKTETIDHRIQHMSTEEMVGQMLMMDFRKNADDSDMTVLSKEAAKQIRLRNLSGIILIDFINMENQDHQDELFHVLQKYLRKDPVKAKAVDVTPLHILELTRKKVRKPVIEEIREL